MNRKVFTNALLAFFVCRHCIAGVSRISEPKMDLSKPMTIYMTPGRATVLDFPCEVVPAILGLTNDITAKVGPDSLKTLTLWVNSDNSQATNMIVKCEGEVFVFDLLPNSHNHQDYVNILDYFDSRGREHLKLIASSDQSRPKEKMKLIASSDKPPSDEYILGLLNKNNKKKKILGTAVKK